MNLTRTFTWGDATIAVRRSVVRDHLAVDVLSSLIYDEGDTRIDTHAKQTYAWIVVRSTVTGDLGFPFPAVDAPTEEWAAGYGAFMNMEDDALFVKWNEELALVNVPVNAAILTPSAPKND